MISNKMFNSDQFASSPSVNTDKRQIQKTALVMLSGPSGNWLWQHRFSSQSGP